MTTRKKLRFVDKNGNAINRYNGGNNRERRTFTKLLRDAEADIRDVHDAVRFIEGMETFRDGNAKIDLLMQLDDNRNQGSRRIHEVMSYIDSVTGIQNLLIPFLSCVMTVETARPLHVSLRNRILLQLYLVPCLLEALVTLRAAQLLPQDSATCLCCFLEAVCASFAEARMNEHVMDLARQLEAREGVDARALCSLVLVRPRHVEEGTILNPSIQESSTVLWTTDLRQPGGRHDNDFLNFRNVRILPTAAELRCELRPWLPLATGANNFVDDPVTRLISNNFRLLREDAISTMRERIDEVYRSWSNCRILDLDVSVRTGIVSFIVQCDAKTTTKKINWELSRLLEYGSVVALCEDETPVMLGIITVRDQKDLGSFAGPRIGVSFDTQGEHFKDALNAFAEIFSRIDGDTTENLASELIEASPTKSKTSFTLIEVSSSFTSYQPILHSLQQMTELGFKKEFCSEEIALEDTPLEYLPAQLAMPDDNICNGHTLDLQSSSVEELIEKTSLDESQARAILHVLNNRVSLIQGPPGTGKTFIGGLIARMLRQNTDESILCLCYTNHALDQFLEHMMDAGETRLVRIGSRSRSDRVVRYNLRELARQKAQQPRHSDRRFKQVIAQMYAAKERIDEHTRAIKQPIGWKHPSGGVEQYLMAEEPELYQCLRLPDLEDGFQIVGTKSKDVSKDYLWKRWYRGHAFPQFLLQYMPEDLPRFYEFWSLPQADRISMTKRWNAEIINVDVNELIESVDEFQWLSNERNLLRQQQDLEILQEARVVGATTTGAAKCKEVLMSKKPGILIVEEAGEVLEPHILSAIQESTKHLILIGDHMQLRPKVESYNLTTVANMGYAFDRSLFERLVLSGLPSVTLGVQHRMRPEISEFVRMQTYPNLIDHSSVKKFKNLMGVSNNVVFIDHRHPEDFADESDDGAPSKTKSNNFEVGMCISIAKFFLQQGYHPDRIAILTPYLGQLQQLLCRMKTDLKEAVAFLSEKDCNDIEEMEGHQRDEEQGEFNIKSLRCSSIDNFQGEEADIVIISLVRSNKKGSIGFLKEAQRVNVLMSRARLGMFIIGNSHTLTYTDRGRCVWDPILQLCESNKQLLNGLPTYCQLHPADTPIVLSTVDDFIRLRPNGGCTKVCGLRMDCGHHCRITCHPFDRDHKELASKCVEACRRVPSACRESHPCPRLCKEDCGPCTFPKGRFQLMDCSHWLENVRCYEINDENAKKKLSQECSALVQFTFESCGHQEQTTCANTKKTTPSCPAKCHKLVERCDHMCAQLCSKCDGNHDCDQVCQRKLFCGHECGRKCHGGNCPPCIKACIVRCVHSHCPKRCKQVCASCVEPCDWHCEHQGRCELVCGAPCSRLPCSERCTRELSCGHRCPSLCGEVCPDDSYCQECCSDAKKNATVDHIMMSSFEEHDVDQDPVIVLPCGHFFSTFTLDGHFGMSDVYLRKDSDFIKYIDTVPLVGLDINEKPRTCPDCRATVHSINRYGRIFRLSELRALERKHNMDVDTALRRIEYFVDEPEFDCDISLDDLEKLEIKIRKGPMRRIYDACINKNDLADVPAPSLANLIRTLELMGRVYSKAAKSRGDDNAMNAKKSFGGAITLADSSMSHRAGCRVRLHLVSALSKWMKDDGTDNDMSEAIEHLDWVLDRRDLFPDLGQQATMMKKSLTQDPKKTIAEVMRAVSAAEGGYQDYYVTNWAAHWYECPNGHPYFIGNCGGAMEVSWCAECGATIGGTSHTLQPTNRRVGVLYAEAMASNNS